MLNRRSLITGLVAFVAPAIVRAGSLMPVKALIDDRVYWTGNIAQWHGFHFILADQWQVHAIRSADLFGENPESQHLPVPPAS